jgi:hypothetical protein
MCSTMTDPQFCAWYYGGVCPNCGTCAPIAGRVIATAGKRDFGNPRTYYPTEASTEVVST